MKFKKTNEHDVCCPNCNETILTIDNHSDEMIYHIYPNSKLEDIHSDKWNQLIDDGDHLDIKGIDNRFAEFSVDLGDCNYCNTKLQFLNFIVSQNEHPDFINYDGSLHELHGDLYVFEHNSKTVGSFISLKNATYNGIEGDYVLVSMNPCDNKELLNEYIELLIEQISFANEKNNI